MTVNVFAVPVFFVVFRETLETVIIVSVLLAFLKQTLDGPSRDVQTYKKLVKQVRSLCIVDAIPSHGAVGVGWHLHGSSNRSGYRGCLDWSLLW
jgi:high-affinity Fe2+/Pb2+ permease